MDEQTERTRERLETSKQRAIAYRDWVYLAISIIVAIMLVWALWSWRQTNLMVGATNAKVDGLLDRLGNKIDVLDTEKLNALLEKAGSRVDDLGKTQQQLTGLISDTRGNTNRLTKTAVARIDQLSENLTSLKGVTDNAALAVTEISDATTKLIAKFNATADEADKAIAAASKATGLTAEALAKQINDPRWGQAADNLVATTGNANKLAIETTATITDVHTDLHETMKQMPHTMAQIDKTATNISKFSKASIIAGIISNLANGFIPGLLR